MRRGFDVECIAVRACLTGGGRGLMLYNLAMGQKIRVLLVDDIGMLREGLAALLRLEADIEVVGEAADHE